MHTTYKHVPCPSITYDNNRKIGTCFCSFKNVYGITKQTNHFLPFDTRFVLVFFRPSFICIISAIAIVFRSDYDLCSFLLNLTNIQFITHAHRMRIITKANTLRSKKKIYHSLLLYFLSVFVCV